MAAQADNAVAVVPARNSRRFTPPRWASTRFVFLRIMIAFSTALGPTIPAHFSVMVKKTGSAL
jgi:hypothetical protein